MIHFARDLLKDRRFLVTGSTGGAGTATAMLLSELGGHVTVMGRDPERTERVKRSLRGGRHSTTATGVYDGIFHAAGIEHMAATGATSPEAVQRVFEPSIDAAFNIVRDIGSRKQSVMKDGGALVLMSSVAAVRGTTGMAIYAASKGAIEALARSCAVEWAPRAIRVNCIRAGAFQSPMHTRIVARTTPQALDEYAARHPLGFGTAEDIANMAVYLMSDMGRWVTGACVAIDGGFSCK